MTGTLYSFLIAKALGGYRYEWPSADTPKQMHPDAGESPTHCDHHAACLAVNKASINLALSIEVIADSW